MNYKLFLAFLVGAAIGLGSGIFIGKKMQEKKDVDDLVEEINQLHSELDEVWESKKALATYPPVEDETEDDKNESDEGMVRDGTYGKYHLPVKKDFDTLKRMASKYRDSDLDAHLAERDYPNEDPAIFEVSEESLTTDYRDVDMEQVFYYPMDDLLVSLSGDVYQEPETVLGAYLTNEIRDRVEDFIYVLNEEQDTVYEIVMQHGLSFEAFDSTVTHLETKVHSGTEAYEDDY